MEDRKWNVLTIFSSNKVSITTEESDSWNHLCVVSFQWEVFSGDKHGHDMDSSRSSMARRCHREGSCQGKERHVWPGLFTTWTLFREVVAWCNSWRGVTAWQIWGSSSSTSTDSPMSPRRRKVGPSSFFHLLPHLYSSSHVQSNSDLQSVRLSGWWSTGLLWNCGTGIIIIITQCFPKKPYPLSIPCFTASAFANADIG